MTDLQANIGRNVCEVQNEIEGFKIFVYDFLF